MEQQLNTHMSKLEFMLLASDYIDAEIIKRREKILLEFDKRSKEFKIQYMKDVLDHYRTFDMNVCDADREGVEKEALWIRKRHDLCQEIFNEFY